MLCVKYLNGNSFNRSGFVVQDAEAFRSLGYDAGNIVYSIDGINEYSYDPKIYSYSFIESINDDCISFFKSNCQFPLFRPMTAFQSARAMLSISGITESDFVMESNSGDKIYKVNPSSVYEEHDCGSFTIRLPSCDNNRIAAIKVKMNGGSSFYIADKISFNSDQSIKTEFGDFRIDRSELNATNMTNIIALFPEAAFHRKTDYSISSF